MKSIRFVAAAIAAAVSLPIAAAQSQGGESVFRIGAFDGSSGEFATGTPQQPVTFIVGRSDPAHAWYGFQPIESKAKPVETAPRTIQFALQQAPASAYTFRVSILIEHPSVPTLKVDINGRRGTFYLDPKLDSRMGDGSAVSFPAYSHAQVEFEFPGQYLHSQGVNTITLAAAEASGEAVPDAGFTYDALELESAPGRKFDQQAASVTVKPTIFYKEDGGVKEVVDALVRYRQRPQDGTVALTVSGKRYVQSLRGDQDFGEEECRFLLPDFGKRAQANAILHMNGRTQRFQQTIEPQKKWTIYVVPHVHLDLGYTDYQAKVAAIQSR
ncbi:MAG: polysaccharide lyase family protein, partial [Acidobacteriaceae bacterium]